MSTRILCMSCCVEVESKSRHDYQSCRCPQGSFVDGGDEYTRAGGMDLSKIKMHRQDAETGCIFIPDGMVDENRTKGHIVYECDTCEKRLECLGEVDCVHSCYRWSR